MGYYYFVDFHTAIIENVFGYLPQLLPFLNAVFILVFGLAIYALTRPNGRRAAMIATVISHVRLGIKLLWLVQLRSSQGTFNVDTKTMATSTVKSSVCRRFLTICSSKDHCLIGLPVFAFVLALLRNMETKIGCCWLGDDGFVFEFHNVGVPLLLHCVRVACIV